ncbi:ImmA/IrrE family metallo-endopeptidase [Muricoccus vinaceus]|uniref:ImmA/IrrE family metallo-endopeptidase n=1 Tax=Muricoccus vinaceus TaxID=424704 RepID=A0ABV6J1E2_9PROT
MASIDWTNASVLRFAGDRDPVEAIEEAAREGVLAALDAGWKGPPFNPIALADIRGIPVEANADVRDARTVAAGGHIRIQFNPTQPRERVRFSIAHEVAHTLFEDVGEAVRHRGGDHSPDDWQLEMLCNIAAAEFVMPVGSLGTIDSVRPIEELMTDRRRFDVSAEAYLLRVGKVAVEPLLVVFASAGDASPRYRVDYAVPSRGWSARVNTISPPDDTILRDCTAVGFTVRGEETWPGLGRVSVECVGLPGYPGRLLPRVACLVRRIDGMTVPREGIVYLQGDVLRPRGAGRRMVLMMVNDAARRWGGGLARGAARRFPRAQDEFSAWITGTPKRERLGQTCFSDVGDGITLVSLVAQEGFGASDTPRVRYSALSRALTHVAEEAMRQDASVHMPRLAAGGAGGSWDVVEGLVTDLLVARGIATTVYDLPPRRLVPEGDLFA